MYYTENFNLPQWVESDRIIMEDFNRMCEEIEKGLNRSSQAAERGLDRLCRLAYNHYCMVQSLKNPPHQTGLFQQDPAKDPTGIGGTAVYWEGLRFAGKAETPLTNEILASCLHKLSDMVVHKNQSAKNSAYTATFQPPASGILQNFALTGQYSDNALRDVLPFRLTLTNQDTGRVEKTLDRELIYSASGNVTFTTHFNDAIPFMGGVNYLITIEPKAANSNLTVALAITQDTTSTTLSNDGIITADHTFREPEDSSGGIMILRCALYGTGGELSFRWDGVERTPDITRSIQAGDGRIIQELIYRREDVVPADSRLSLRFESAVGGSFLFYDWGAVLF